MKKRLATHESLLIGSLLFGLFFGAGNLIFPVKLGQESGSNLLLSTTGFLITGVGLPLLGIIASAVSKSESMHEMATPIGRKYATFFTCLLYLTIGPLFAIPRTATVAFEVGIRSFIGDKSLVMPLFIFSVIFFLLTIYFSLKPTKIIDIVGKYLTPLFLILLSVLVFFAFVRPMGRFMDFPPQGKYLTQPLTTGIIDGYNTMDALAAIAFAIIIISNIRRLGVKDPMAIAVETGKSGLVCAVAMGLIYGSLTYVGATSLGSLPPGENGGQILSMVSEFYLGVPGKVLLAGIVTVACLKTAIGLITACSQMFITMFPNSLNYRKYAFVFTLASFIIANAGLGKIIQLSIPVLMFAYPLAITLILLSLLSPKIKDMKPVYVWTTVFTICAEFGDLLNALPDYLKDNFVVSNLVDFYGKYLPGYSLGFGWIIPAFVGMVIGFLLYGFRKRALS